MTLWQRIKRFSRSLVILALSCLVLEQVWYSVVVPGYFLGVLVSPVFWGIFAISCFYLLWRFDRDYFKEVEFLKNEKTIWHPIEDEFWKPICHDDWKSGVNPATGLLMCGNCDIEGNLYGVSNSNLD